MELHIRESLISDAACGVRLRDADKEELEACGHAHPCIGLELAISSSMSSYTIIVNGTPEAFTGITDEGVIWALTTDKMVTSYKKLFMKYSYMILGQYKKQFPLLHNMVYSKNVKHITWLKHLGFTISTPIVHKGHLFYYFYMET